MTQVKNHTHLLFTEGFDEHTGGDLAVVYSKTCPAECRN